MPDQGRGCDHVYESRKQINIGRILNYLQPSSDIMKGALLQKNFGIAD